VHEELVKRLVEKVESKRHEIADYRVTNPDAERVFVTYGSPSRSVEQVIHDNPGRRSGISASELSGLSPKMRSVNSRTRRHF